jgi:site-specific DNA recombinase
VQRKLADNRANRTSRTNASHPSLLAGLLYDETGDRLTPTHANNHGKRYRFYISHRLTMQRRSRIEGWRLPAFELEKAVLSGLAESLRDPKALADLARLNSADAVTIDACTTNAGKLADQLQAGGTEKTLEFLRQVISRIEISPGNLKLEVIRQTLRSALCGNSTASEPVDNADIAEVQLPFQMRRRGVEAKLMMAGATPSKPSQDTNLVQLIQDVHRWIDNLIVGQVPSIDELAEHEGIPASEISRTLQLAFLAPDLMKSILLGTQPADLTTQSLKRLGKLPACWREQRRLLGMQGQSCSAS